MTALKNAFDSGARDDASGESRLATTMETADTAARMYECLVTAQVE